MDGGADDLRTQKVPEGDTVPGWASREEMVVAAVVVVVKVAVVGMGVVVGASG